MRSLIIDCRDGFVYALDKHKNSEKREVWFIHVHKLPESCIPGLESFRPRDQITEQGFQDVYVAQKWDYTEVANYPRQYLNAYAFNAAFGPGGDPGALMLDYNFTQGWVFQQAVRADETECTTGEARKAP